MVANPRRLIRTGMDGKPFRCPFCEGNEADTPPEVYRVGGGEANKPGWQIRVVPNLFPITDIHEVIVHSPDHEKNIEDFSQAQVENIIKTYINRFNFLKDKGKVFIFHNCSLTSGASLIHPHSQVSIVPSEIPTITLAVQPVVNIVEQVGEFVSYCPEYSEWAYEVWIKKIASSSTSSPPRNDNEDDLSLRALRLRSGQAPRSNLNFENINETQIKNLAKILQSSIRKLKKIHATNPHYAKKPYGYNFYIFVPSHPKGDQTQPVIPSEVEESFYLRIIPRFMERAGFELSTGIMVNSVSPEKAAEELKKTIL